MEGMQGKVAIITGASSGIGRAAAYKFAWEGAQVALVARNESKLKESAAELGGNGSKAKVIPADVTREEQVDRIVSETVAEFGGIDVVVNAAGIIANGTIENTTMDDWDRLFRINVRAPFCLIQRAMPYLIERKGNVVNVSSVNGLRAFPGVLA